MDMMMNFLWSWDMVLLVLLGLLFSYNILLGKKSNIKVILSLYISIFVTEGILHGIFSLSQAGVLLLENTQSSFFSLIRIVLFLASNVLFLAREPLTFHIRRHDHWGVRMILHFLFSLFAAFLFVSTFFLFFEGETFINGFQGSVQIPLMEQSLVARGLLEFYQAWFSIPAFLILCTSFFFPSASKTK